MTEPVKLVSILKIVLADLERSLGQSPQDVRENDSRTEQLRGRIDRLGSLLKKRQAAVRRCKALDRENKKRNHG